MIKLVFPEPIYRHFNFHCTAAPGPETAGIAFTVGTELADVQGRDERRLVREVWLPEAEDYLIRTSVRIQLKAEYVLNALIHAQKKNFGAVFMHTHPSQEWPNFSETDDQGERSLRALFEARAPGRPHIAMVQGNFGAAARVLGTPEPVAISILGRRLAEVTSMDFDSSAPDVRYARQVAILSENGQETLGRALIVIVGLGGTGSLIAQQLAHLGFKHFLLIDTDKIEDTNLNRVVGASYKDIGKPKVEIARRLIQSINPEASVDIEVADVGEPRIVHRLTIADAIMLCTDSHGSRAVANKLAYQYLVPTVDMGAYIDVTESSGVRLRGRVQLLAPGLPCLHCYGLLDPNRVRYELQSPAQRKRDPYGLPEGAKQPAVISLNSTVTSLAVTMLLQTLTILDGEVRGLRYDGVSGQVRETTMDRNQKCPDCADKYAAAGNSERLIYCEVD